MKEIFYKSLETKASVWVVFIRLSLSGVFFLEGIQKLIFPAILGTGRFETIGIPFASVMGPFVGIVELVCGFLLIFGLCVRLSTIPLIATMIVAMLATKLPILLGHDWLMFNLRDLSRYGFWSFTHESRTDWAMLMGALYLLAVGGGRWSFDYFIYQKKIESEKS